MKSSIGVKNGCGACGEDFSSVDLFDRHRVGKHAYDYVIGDPDREDGRRCLDYDEMTTLGWVRNDEIRRWSDPASSARAAAAFRKKSNKAD